MSAESSNTGALPVEPAANEMDDAKKLEATIDVKPNGTAVDAEVNTEATSAPLESTASNGSQDAPKLSDSEIEDKVVQDAVKQSASIWSDLSRHVGKLILLLHSIVLLLRLESPVRQGRVASSSWMIFP